MAWRHGLVVARRQPGKVRTMDRFIFRARVLFGLLLVVAVVAGLTAVGAGDVPATVRVMLSAAVVLWVVASIALLSGLDRGQAWSMSATIWVCVGLVIFGVLRFFSGLAEGVMTIPLEAVGALIVLASRSPTETLPSLDAAGRRTRAFVVGAFVVSWAGSLFAVLPPGDVGGVDPDALEVAVTLDCAGSLETGQGPRVGVQVDWGWIQDEAISPTNDGLVVRWSGPGTTDDPTAPGMVISDAVTTQPADAVWPGNASPAAALMTPIAAQGPSADFGIRMDPRLAGGYVAFPLEPAEGDRAHGTVTVWAAYAHGDRWLKKSDAATCTW